ncbi:hypothetical protein G113_11019 [Aeromonas molluscorum 848]|uniref:Uncharacterized protein n=1 Tax=Aeromonas molluscorum 848 TaxID=1268236 RepID=R1F5E4_9GAMM|nr:hypothetical protein G113_11019 [Aeromonas molluscorum 848]
MSALMPRLAKLNAGHRPSTHNITALIPSLDEPLLRALGSTSSEYQSWLASVMILDRHQYSIYPEKHIRRHHESISRARLETIIKSDGYPEHIVSWSGDVPADEFKADRRINGSRAYRALITAISFSVARMRRWTVWQYGYISRSCQIRKHERAPLLRLDDLTT